MSEDLSYYRRRATDEEDQARNAASAVVRDIHLTLATAYRKQTEALLALELAPAPEVARGIVLTLWRTGQKRPTAGLQALRSIGDLRNVDGSP